MGSCNLWDDEQPYISRDYILCRIYKISVHDTYHIRGGDFYLVYKFWHNNKHPVKNNA